MGRHPRRRRPSELTTMISTITKSMVSKRDDPPDDGVRR